MLFELIDRFDVLQNFSILFHFWKAWNNPILKDFFEFWKSKHINYTSAKIRMEKSVFPKSIKYPVQVFFFGFIPAIQNKTVWTGFKKWFSCVSSSWQYENWIFRRSFFRIVRAYCEIEHNSGFKIDAPPKYFEKKTKKKPKKKEKKKAFWKEARNCVKVFWKKFFCKFFTKKTFFKNPEGLTFTQYSGWTGKPPILLCFFYFLTVLLLTEFLSMETRVNKSAQKDASRKGQLSLIFYDNKLW